MSSLRTRIVQLRRLPEGETVGYGCAGVLSRDSVVATVPVGYADGLDRHLGCGRWAMRVGGRPAPIVGRVCMDSCMIDVTDLPQLKVGDEIEVFGEHQLIETAAKQCGTISYELLCAVSKRVPRYYYLGGKCVDRNLQLLG